MFKKLAFALAVCLPFVSTASEAAVDHDAILADLMAGNARFVRGDLGLLPRIDEPRREELTAGQHPKAVVLGCADSRTPPEHLFRQGLGDLFVTRIAGNVPMTGMIASIEYAVEHLHAPVIVVMGHSKCGAVKATIEVAESPTPVHLTPALDALVAEIAPAVEEAGHLGGDLLARSIEVNAELAAKNLLDRSEVIRHAVSIGEVRLVVAEYDLATGAVSILDPDVRPAAHH